MQWRRLLSTGLPALARDIVATIIREIPEYRDGPSHAVFAETQRNVNEALQAFVQRLADPAASQRAQSSGELFELFRQLGRNEAIAGRRHDTLQAAYRIASRMIMRRLLEWEREYPIPAERVTELSSSIFDFIDRLADLSAEGYADALGDDPDLARQRARLLELLLDPRGVSQEAVAIRAQQLSWPVPERATLLELDGLDDTYDPPAVARLARTLLDKHALGGHVLGRSVLLSSSEVDCADARRAARRRSSRRRASRSDSTSRWRISCTRSGGSVGSARCGSAARSRTRSRRRAGTTSCCSCRTPVAICTSSSSSVGWGRCWNSARANGSSTAGCCRRGSSSARSGRARRACWTSTGRPCATRSAGSRACSASNCATGTRGWS